MTLRAAGALVVLVAVQVSVLGLYLPAGVQNIWKPVVSAPDDHFTAGPDCRVLSSGSGRVGGAGSSPGIISAATRGTSYYRKMVGAVHLNRLGD